MKKDQTSSNGSDFLPEGYEAPANGKNYMKLQQGENRIRIISKPIVGWLDWKDNKPMRFKMNNKPSQPVDPKKPIRHFWAMLVWNYANECPAVLELTQSTIQARITELSKDEDWGNPMAYDIKIMKSGESLGTEYSVNPVSHKPLSQEIQDAITAKGHVNLEALFENGDPFSETHNVSDKTPF